jgi:hypothetical protein
LVERRDFGKVKEELNECTGDELYDLCYLLDLNVSGTKSEKLLRILKSAYDSQYVLNKYHLLNFGLHIMSYFTAEELVDIIKEYSLTRQYNKRGNMIEILHSESISPRELLGQLTSDDLDDLYFYIFERESNLKYDDLVTAIIDHYKVDWLEKANEKVFEKQSLAVIEDRGKLNEPITIKNVGASLKNEKDLFEKEIKQICEEYLANDPKPEFEIFISFCDNYIFVKKIVKILIKNNYSPIIYPINPDYGKNIEESIGERIKQSDFFIFIIGECTMNSHYVDNEVGYAFSLVHNKIKHQKFVIPLIKKNMVNNYKGFYSQKTISIHFSDDDLNDKSKEIIEFIKRSKKKRSIKIRRL